MCNLQIIYLYTTEYYGQTKHINISNKQLRSNFSLKKIARKFRVGTIQRFHRINRLCFECLYSFLYQYFKHLSILYAAYNMLLAYNLLTVMWIFYD